MPTARRPKSTARSHAKARSASARKAVRARPKTVVRPSGKRPRTSPAKPSARKPSDSQAGGTKGSAARPATRSSAPAGKAKGEARSVPELTLPLPGGRRHVLSLSFVRDGDEFFARLESDAGQITELKNRSLDQLLTLVAGELEDLLE